MSDINDIRKEIILNIKAKIKIDIEKLVENLPCISEYDPVVVFDDGVHIIKERRK